jgi:hypothetical protein
MKGVAQMDFLKTYAKELFSLAVPIVSAIVTRLLRARVRLTYASPHGYTYLIQEPLRNAEGVVINPMQNVQTRSFWLRNDGTATAHKVEVIFNWKPLSLNVWPIRHFDAKTEPDNRYVLTFETLAPREDLGFEILSVNANLPDLVTFRCEEAVGKKVTMYPQRTVPNWARRLIIGVLFLGAAAAVYLFIIALQWLILKTPIALSK